MFAVLDARGPAAGSRFLDLKRRARDNSGLIVFVFLGAALLTLTSLPVLVTRIPSLIDYLNHLGRIYVIAEDGGDAILSQYYGVHWTLIPNLAMDIVVPPLVKMFGIYGAGKFFLAATIALLVSGPHAIHRALYNRLSFWPFAACLFIYNESFNEGLMNYLFGVGIALWGVAAWIALARAPAAARAAVSSAFMVVVYICHLAAAGVYVVAVASFEVWRASCDVQTYWRRLLCNARPLLLLFPLLLLLHHFQPMPAVDQVLRWDIVAKIRGIIRTFGGEEMFRTGDALVSVTVVVSIGWVAWRRGLLRPHPAALPVIIASTVAFLAAPSEIMGGSGVDTRLPIAFIFVLIGFLDWELSTVRACLIFSLALASLLVVRVSVVEYVWHELAIDTTDMARSAIAIKPGSRILVVREDHPTYRGGYWLSYLPCLMMIERSSLVSLAYSDPTQQILAVKPSFRRITGGFNDDPPSLSELASPPLRSPSTPSGRIYWSDWEKNYDYVYLVSLNGESPVVPKSLKQIYEAHHFRIYAVKAEFDHQSGTM